MKGTYVKSHKKTPTLIRSMQCDSWHLSELALDAGVAPQSGQSPRGCGIRFNGMQRHQDNHWLHWHSL